MKKGEDIMAFENGNKTFLSRRGSCEGEKNAND